MNTFLAFYSSAKTNKQVAIEAVFEDGMHSPTLVIDFVTHT